MPESLLELFNLWNLVDIAIVAYFFYKISMMIRETRAVQLLKGLLFLLLVAYVSNRLQLQTVSWLLTQFQTMLIVALPIVFQPELRKALERIGQGTMFSHQAVDKEAFARMVEGNYPGDPHHGQGSDRRFVGAGAGDGTERLCGFRCILKRRCFQ